MTLYIDPGTGSMLFTILIAVIGSLVYLLRGLKVKMGLMLHRGEQKTAEAEKIPLVIFSETKRYWPIFEPICRELVSRGQKVVYLTESADDPAFQAQSDLFTAECIGEGNRAYTRLNFLKARIVFATTPGLDVFQWKRSRDVDYYVHIQHSPSDVTRYRMFGIDHYDAILLSGEYQIEEVQKLEQMRKLPAKELVLVGVPYMDEMKKQLDRLGPPAEHERTVLLAPSWGETAILKRYGAKMIDALLSTGYHLIIRPHPQSFDSETEMLDQMMKAYPDSEQVEWNRDISNFEVLRRSDIMISDFSGVIFDYTLIFDKPVLYADVSYDPAPYDACWIREPLWTYKVLPTLGEQISEEMLPDLKSVIDRCIENPMYQEARNAARKETWRYQGEGAVRAADYLIRKLAQMEAESLEKTVPADAVPEGGTAS